LVSEVALGQVGAVFGLEVSRLARSCADWYRLLEVAALTGCYWDLKERLVKRNYTF
jgi:DNA invertase Pin-like site-specific DNA recombinase